MVKMEKSIRKSKWNNIGVPPEVNRDLDRICKYRGWSKKIAVERMAKRELILIEQEQAASRP
jgi:hypothetical protein